MRAVLCKLALALTIAATGCGDSKPAVATDPAAERQAEEQNKQEAQREGKARRAAKGKGGE